MIVKEIEDELMFQYPKEFNSEVINFLKSSLQIFLLQLLQMNKY